MQQRAGLCALLALSLGSANAAPEALRCAQDDADCFAALSVDMGALDESRLQGSGREGIIGRKLRDIEYDDHGDVKTKWWISPGHPNDGNEGDEGNEGNYEDEPTTTITTSPTTTTVTKCTINGNPVDANGNEIGPWYQGVNHNNDGNEGNEGNEGVNNMNDVMKCEEVEVEGSEVEGPVDTTNMVYKCTINGNPVDANKNEIGKWYQGLNHNNDGNEGNEGNEGVNNVNDVMKCEWVDADGVADDDVEVVVDDDGEDIEVEVNNSQCGQFLSNTDVPGANLGGSGTSVSTAQACLDLCSKTTSCNAAVRTDNKKCYMKTVAQDVETTILEGATSFIMCADGSLVDPNPSPPTAFTPTPPSPDLSYEDNLKTYFKNDVCPTTLTTIQWTGKANNQIGVPGAIQALYAEYGGSNYNPSTKKYTLDFDDLPADLTYCSESKDYKDECSLTMTVKGPGSGSQTKWSYNQSTKKCEEFEYSGSGGNGNNYDTQALCATACETPEPATMGGQVFFQTDDGKCVLPPTKSNGDSCCVMKVWQPNYAGFYYDNCSAKFELGADGLYYFKTEIPGSELAAKWGPDPEAHIHYDIECNNCGSNEIFSGTYKYWNKFYPKDICTLATCYGRTQIAKIAGLHHQASHDDVDGEQRYTYNMLLPHDGA